MQAAGLARTLVAIMLTAETGTCKSIGGVYAAKTHKSTVP